VEAEARGAAMAWQRRLLTSAPIFFFFYPGGRSLLGAFDDAMIVSCSCIAVTYLGGLWVGPIRFVTMTAQQDAHGLT
jgi:hypothetical protein